MEAKVREIYTELDKRRKEHEGLEADKHDLKELKQLEEKIKKEK